MNWQNICLQRWRRTSFDSVEEIVEEIWRSLITWSCKRSQGKEAKHIVLPKIYINIQHSKKQSLTKKHTKCTTTCTHLICCKCMNNMHISMNVSITAYRPALLILFQNTIRESERWRKRHKHTLLCSGVFVIQRVRWLRWRGTTPPCSDLLLV